MKRFVPESLRQVKKIIVAVIGFTVLFIGIVMIVLPGPALLVIPLGLGILATEFVWARRFLKKMKEKLFEKNKKSGQKK